MKSFKVTPAHGRVKRNLPNGQRVLVAIPGQEIPYELAEELGLVEASEPEPVPEPEPEKSPEPEKKTAKTASYPTKKSRK